jgi:hypothetical protein
MNRHHTKVWTSEEKGMESGCKKVWARFQKLDFLENRISRPHWKYGGRMKC